MANQQRYNYNYDRYKIRLLPWQEQVGNDTTKYRVIVAGRRSGKSTLCRYLAYLRLKEPYSKVVWVSPTHPHVIEQWEKFISELPYDFIADHPRNKDEKQIDSRYYTIKCINGSIIQFVNGSKMTKIVGQGISFLVLDECGLIEMGRVDQWLEHIAPTLATEPRSKMIAIGTYNYQTGRDCLLWDLHRLTLKSERYKLFTYDSTVNPDNDLLEEIEAARKELPHHRFMLVYGAGLPEDTDSAVFRNSDIEHAMKVTGRGIEPPRRGRRYIMGWDPARKVDNSVITIMDITEEPYHLVYIYSMNDIPWPTQFRKVSDLAEYYRPEELIWDATGASAIDEWLKEKQSQGLYIPRLNPIQSYQTKKRDMIEALQILLETGRLSIPDMTKHYQTTDLINELRHYQRVKRGQSFKYECPRNMNDDTVDSLCLTVYGAANYNRISKGKIRTHRMFTNYQDEIDTHISKCTECNTRIIYTGYEGEDHTCKDCRIGAVQKSKNDNLMNNLTQDHPELTRIVI